MSISVEVCVDSSESLVQALKGGAHRIELCSSLDLGGLTPSYGLMKQAQQISTVPVYAMIRPRQGDFLYTSDDVEVMLSDIHCAKQLGLPGIVVGCLTHDGKVDKDILKQLVNAAGNMGVTFHRAIDHAANPLEALDAIISADCERVLSSGGACDALSGINTLKEMVVFSGTDLSIMAGAGVTADNVISIITQTGVREVHLSGKTLRRSHMTHSQQGTNMSSKDVDDFSIPVTDAKKVTDIVTVCL